MHFGFIHIFEGTGTLIMLLILFLFGIIPFTYLLSFLFKSPPKAQLMTILLYVILGMVLGIVSLVLNRLGGSYR